MNQFVKGVKNLALALSFVSVCACSSVENADLNVVNKEFGGDGENELDPPQGNGHKKVVSPREDNFVKDKKELVGDKGNVTSENKDSKPINIKEYLNHGRIDFNLLERDRVNLEGCEIIVDDKFNIQCDGVDVYCFEEINDRLEDFIDYVVQIGFRGGLLQSKSNVKIKISFVKNGQIKIGSIKTNSVGEFVMVVQCLGGLSKKNFNSLFDCSGIKKFDNDDILDNWIIAGLCVDLRWDCYLFLIGLTFLFDR